MSLTALEERAKAAAAGEGPTNIGSQTLADVLSQAGPTFENYFQKSVQDPLMQLFGEKVIPQLDVELARSGFFGSGRERALGGATDRLMRALTESKAGLSKELLDTRLRGAEMAPGIGQGEIDQIMTLLEGGDTRRQKELDRIKLLLSLLGGPHVGPETSEGRQNTAAGLRIGGAVAGGIVGGPAGATVGATAGGAAGKEATK